ARPAAMKRPPRSPSAPARPVEPRAASDRPPGVARPLVAGVLALIGLRALAAWLPGRWLWGLDLGRDVPRWSFALGTLVPLAACLARVARPISAAWPSGRSAARLLALTSALALAAFVLAHPDETLYTGDTWLRHGEFSSSAHPEQIAQQAMPGDLFL